LEDKIAEENEEDDRDGENYNWKYQMMMPSHPTLSKNL